MVVAPVMVPLLVRSLVLVYPAGRLRTRVARTLAATCYAVAVLVGPVRVLVYDSFFDQPVGDTARPTPSWSPAGRRRQVLLDIGLAVWTVVGFVVALSSLARLLGASASGRRHTWGVLLPLAAAAFAEGAYAAAILGHMREDPASLPFGPIFVARAGALSLLGVGIAWAALGDRRRTMQLARLAGDLGNAQPVGSLSARLANLLTDRGLTIGYWLAESEDYADASGRLFLPHPTAGQTVTSVQRAGEPVAVIVHDRIRTDAGRLGRALGPAARMAIDNERLRAARLAQLTKLRSSRSRIVEAGDQARRRLEHDLHDGAQLQLTMVIYELLRASARAQREDDGQQVRALAVAIREARAALAELREIAHGMFPAILEEAGLASALETVAELAKVPVEIAEVPQQRFPSRVERAAYVVVASAVAAAEADRPATVPVSVAVTCTPDHVIVDVLGVGVCRDGDVADRVGSLGGTLTHQQRQLRVEIPCG